MIASVAWKEYREHRSFWLVLALLTVATLSVMSQVFVPGSPWVPTGNPYVLTVVAAFILAGMYGMVCGGMMIAGERESQTVAFLDNLPAGRGELWFVKLFVGVVLTATHTLLTIGAVKMIGLDKNANLPRWWALALLGVAAESFAWGLCLSAACRTVLAAIAAATLIPVVVVWTVCSGAMMVVPEMLVGSRFLLAMGALSTSLALFTNRDWEKRFALSSKPPRGTSAPKRAPLAWQAVLWVSLRQGRVEMAASFGIAFVLGLALPWATLPVWFVGTVLIGGVCGAAVFAGEQAEQANRLYGDQRLPVGRVWAWKTGLWLATAAAAAAVMALIGALRDAASSGPGSRLQGIDDLAPVFDWVFAGATAAQRRAGVTALGASGLLTGFAFGQFTCLVWRKSAVAVVVAVMGAAGALALWVPSLIAGGMRPWQMLAPPLILLAACRLSQWAWAADQLLSKRPLLELLAGVGLGLLWAVGVFAYRAQEPPASAEPFDVAAFRATLTRPGDDEVGPLFREALRDAQERETAALAELVNRRALRNDLSPRTETESVLAEGMSAASPGLKAYLDLATAGSWLATLRKATSLDPVMLFDPRAVTRTTTELDTYRALARTMAAHALRVQEQGRHEEGLEQLRTVLAMGRHIQHLAPPVAYEAGRDIESAALDGLGHWLNAAERRPELVKKALDALGRHEALRPAVTVPLKIQCVNILRDLDESGVGDHGSTSGRRLDAEAMGVVLVTPWELARSRRVVNAVYAGRLRAAEAPSLPPPVGQTDTSAGAVLADWQPAPEHAPDTAQRLADLIESSWLRGVTPHTAELQRAERAQLCRLRGLRLQAALLLHELTKGRPAAALDDLVPDLLAEVPTDRFAGQVFRYRVSPGERVLWPQKQGKNLVGHVPLELPAGRGVVWCAGPDARDHGGRRQWDGDDKVQEADMIFLVPRSAN